MATVNEMSMKRISNILLSVVFVFICMGCTKKNTTSAMYDEPSHEVVVETICESIVNDEEYCEPEIDTLGLIGVWAWESLKLREDAEKISYSWGEGFPSDYDSFVIDKRNGKLYVEIVGYGEYNITELSKLDECIKLSFYFPQATKTETFYIRMLSEYELIFVDADENNTTQFFRVNNGTRFFRLAGPADVPVLKTPYMARVSADSDIMWFDEAVHVENGTLVRIVGFSRTEPIQEDNYNKKFHVLFEDTGGYIEGKYLEILSDQVIY